MTEEDNCVKFIFLSVLYTNLKGKTPDSVESIKEFCSDTNLPWCDLDWSKVECQKLDNGKVRMIYKPDKNSSLTIDINEPSLSPEDADFLKKALEELRKERAK